MNTNDLEALEVVFNINNLEIDKLIEKNKRILRAIKLIIDNEN